MRAALLALQVALQAALLAGARALLLKAPAGGALQAVQGEQGVQDAVRRARLSAPRLFLGSEALARGAGFALEAHRVRTDDGFLLTLHRLAAPGPAGPAGDPVLLVHGIFCASDLWLLTPRRHALAFLLADRGYDVWLANLRGNEYSRAHERLSPKEPAFWNHSWHEMGVYDAPASVDYVLRATRRRQLFYVGHSMGNTVYYVMLAARPEYSARVRLHVAMAPAVFMGGMRTPLARSLAPHSAALVRALDRAHAPELLPASLARTALLFAACGGGDGAGADADTPAHALCAHAFAMAYGPTHPGLNASQLPFFLAHVLQSTSIRTPAHFAQSILSGRFRQWDEGSAEGNMRRYGRPSPPDYDLRRVRAPSAIFYSDDDFAVHPRDVEHLATQQQHVVLLFKVPDRPYNHMDFLFTPTAVHLYERILKLLAQF